METIDYEQLERIGQKVSSALKASNQLPVAASARKGEYTREDYVEQVYDAEIESLRNEFLRIYKSNRAEVLTAIGEISKKDRDAGIALRSISMDAE